MRMDETNIPRNGEVWHNFLHCIEYRQGETLLVASSMVTEMKWISIKLRKPCGQVR